MTCEVARSATPELVFRVAHRDDPWEWPDLRAAPESGHPPNRWDDPDRLYAVLYAASTKRAAFVEVLARFRKDLQTIAGLEEVKPDGDDPDLRPGEVPKEWASNRAMGCAVLQGEFCDVGASKTLAHLRTALAATMIEFKLEDLDASTVRLSRRGVTMRISRYIYECADEDGRRTFAGIRYPSKHGDELENWAVFQNTLYEQAPFVNVRHDDINPDDPDFVAAVALHGLTLQTD